MCLVATYAAVCGAAYFGNRVLMCISRIQHASRQRRLAAALSNAYLINPVLSADRANLRATDEQVAGVRLLPKIFGERKQGLGDAGFGGQESQGCDDIVGVSQPSGQQLHKVLMDLWVLLSKALEGSSAEEAKLAVSQGMDRCGPWQPVDHSEIADDCTRSDDRNYALFNLRRYQTDLDQKASS